MWSRFTGKSDSSSSASAKDRDEDARRRRRPSESTRSKRERDSDARSVVSSTSTRKPSRRDTAPSSIASFATAFDDVPRSQPTHEVYDSGRDDRYPSSPSTTRRSDRDEKGPKKSKDKAKKNEWRRSSTRSERSGSASQAGGHRGDIVESPKPISRTFSGQIASDGFSPFPGQSGAPMMSGALPIGSLGSHVDEQFPGMNPTTYASSKLPGRSSFGAAAEYYNDNGASVQHQPGVRPQPPAVIVGQDTPHLVSASAQANPVADTGSGAAADFYANSMNNSSFSKPSRPSRPSSSSMPGAFIDDSPAPQKPPRPSKPSKPAKPSKFGTASTVAGGAALGYAMGHSSSSSTQHSNGYSASNTQYSPSYSNITPITSASTYYNGGDPNDTVNGNGSYPPPYSGPEDNAPPPKPPRPGKSEKQSSGSHAGLYAAGAAGLAAYGLNKHNSQSNTHSHTHQHAHNYSSMTTSGAFSGQHYNGLGPPPSSFMNGGMAQRHEHKGPVSKFVDWWKDYEDVQKMEEYTEYIGVCKGCFDPRSSVLDAPRKHHYHKRRSNEYLRPSGGIEKQSRYSLKEKKSHASFSSGDERRRRNGGTSAVGWVAAGLGGLGLAKAGKAVFSAGRDDFDDTYSIKSGRESRASSIKSGRESRSRISRQRSRSWDRKSYSYGYGDVRRRSRSQDRTSQISVGVTKDKKDYSVVRRRSRSRSRSSSDARSRKSGLLGTTIGVGLAGAALGAATKKHRSRSRSPKRVQLQHHRRDSSEDEHRRRRSQHLRHKVSKSSTSGASVIEIGQDTQSQGSFFSGFFSAPPPKEKKYKSTIHQKQRKGFFNFGNGSSSSSDSEMAFGTGYVKRRQRPLPKHRSSSPKLRAPSLKRQTSEERLRATLAGLGATAAAIAAARAARNAGKRHSDVVAVKEHRRGRKSSKHSRPGSRYGDDEWEDLPDDDTSESSDNAGLVYGDYDWRKGKSQESLASNGSGTNKWGWRWGFGKKKRRSSENLYDNIASTSLIGPTGAATAGTIAGGATGSSLARHDSESSSVHTLQSVYPVAPHHPDALFDARRTSSVPTPQPLVTSGPGSVSLQQPQPMPRVPGAIYSTQASSQSGFVAPAGPPVFSQGNYQQPYPSQSQTQNITIQAPPYSEKPPLPRRSNSSPIQTTSWKRDMAIAGLAATAGAAAIAAANRGNDRAASDVSNVRFNLTQEQAAKEARERRREQDRRDEEESRRREQQRREDEIRQAEEDRRREQQRRDDEDRLAEQKRRDEETNRQREMQRQQEEARKYMESERLAKLEFERRMNEQRRHHEEMQAREAREAEERQRQDREARAEAQRQLDRDTEAEQSRKSRRQFERQEMERIESARREAEIQEDLERRRREREAQEYSSRYESDRERRKIEPQPTGSSVSSIATDVRRKEQELTSREREIFQPDPWKSSSSGAVAATAAAAIASAAISSYASKDKDKKKKERREERKRDSSSSDKKSESSKAKIAEPSKTTSAEPNKAKTAESSKSKTSESGKTKAVESSKTKTKTTESSRTKTIEPSKTKTVGPSNVKTYEPSRIEQDYFDEEIFNPDIFKKKETVRQVYQDLEDRYNAKPVSQAEFFAPKELLENTNLPKTRPVDPNEGITDLHIYQAHDDYGPTPPMAPPYPPSYAFTATRDGRPSSQPTWPVPSLNLIQATPPGSRAPSVRSVSLPPSPAIEPVPEARNEPRLDEANRARSRVSWGENQFHHFEVPTPESFREQFVSEGELKDQDRKYPQDKVAARQDVPKSDNNAGSYEAYRPPQSGASTSRESAPSTQYIRDKDDSTWESVAGAVSKKSNKIEQKKAKAAATVATTAAAVTAAALLSRDDDDKRDYRRDVYSTISNPFSDTHAASSNTDASTVVSSAPSESTVVYSPQYQPSAQPTSSTGSKDHSYGSGSVASSAHSASTAVYSPQYQSSLPSASWTGSTEYESSIVSSAASASTAVYAPQYQHTAQSDPRTAKREQPQKSKSVERQTPSTSASMHVPGSFDDIEESLEEQRESSSSSAKKEKSKTSKSTNESVVLNDAPKRSKPEPVKLSQPIKEASSETDAKLSKKERRKKSKAGKRVSVDSWELEDSDASLAVSPTIDRDPRDIEPRQMAPPTRDTVPTKPTTRREEGASGSSSSKLTTAALTGGFAALVGTAMTQDQDRMTSDFERASKSLAAAEKDTAREGPSSSSHSTRKSDEGERSNTIPSMVFEDGDELPNVKTPKRNTEKRHSSSKWSPSIGSPLRTETKYEDYMGSQRRPSLPNQQAYVAAPKVPTASSDDMPRKDSNEHHTSNTQSMHKDNEPAPQSQYVDKSKTSSKWDDDRTNPVNRFNDDNTSPRSKNDDEDDDDDTVVRIPYDDDDDMKSMISLSSKYDDPERAERRRLRREAKAAAKAEARPESREPSRDRGYGFDVEGERKRRHRRHGTDDRTDDWDTRSTMSEARSDANGERRRKHKNRDGERDGSPEAKTRSRSSANSEPGDEERKSSRRKSRRDGDDDNASVISTTSRYDEDRGSKKERKEEKRSSGLFGMFSSKSKENLLESSKSSKSKDDDDEEHKHRRRKHRSDRGSTYGSDDDDMRSTISSSSRREKRSSRSERGEGERRGSYDDKVHRSSYAR